nr:coiled-coil domain-containing protein 34-like [Nomia melanderi]
MNSIGVQKGKDKPKKKRFSFLQKSFQDKKKRKDLENRDRKKIVEKAVSKKRQKYPTAFKGDQQCECCKCSTDTKSADKMIRERKENEKKILYKLKAKKRKEKKRRKDEIRKAEKYANICFRDTCK